jgi:hypothetical protein
MNTIILSRSATGWVADFSASAKAVEVRRLFGRALLPTAFDPEAHPARVTAEIQRLNPGARIVVSA